MGRFPWEVCHFFVGFLFDRACRLNGQAWLCLAWPVLLRLGGITCSCAPFYKVLGPGLGVWVGAAESNRAHRPGLEVKESRGCVRGLLTSLGMSVH